MKTDITNSISGAAGTPLAHQTIQSGRNAEKQITAKFKSNDAISDTLETTDRDPDGRRRVIEEVESQVVQPDSQQPGHTDGIDLIG